MFFKRSFRSFKRGKTGGGFRRKRFSSNGRRQFGKSTAFKAKSNLTTVNISKSSAKLRQSLPDRVQMWLFSDMAGNYVAVSAATNSFQFAIDGILDPYNFTGGSGVKIPGPLVPIASLSPTTAKNWLFNLTTGTGLYFSYRVWRTKLEICLQPEVAGDTSIFSAAPTNATTFYGNAIVLGQAPQGKTRTITSAAQGNNNLFFNLSMPQIRGLSDTAYEADIVYGQATTPGVYMQVAFATNDGGTTVAPMGIRIRMAQFVEFFSRVDSALLTS